MNAAAVSTTSHIFAVDTSVIRAVTDGQDFAEALPFSRHGRSELQMLWSCNVVGHLLALFRMLTPGIAPQAATAFYRRTLALYIGGVTTAFASLVIAAFL